jgi:AraC-like DNA-binding protein
MKYLEIKAEGFLSNFIKCFWEFQNGNEIFEYTILPDGYFDLIVEFKKNELKSIFLTGVWTKPVNIKTPANTTLFGIRCKLLAAEYLFKHTIKSILNTSIPLPIYFWEIDKLNPNNFEQFVDVLSNHINLSIKHLKEIDSRKINLFRLIYQNKIYNVSQLSEKVFWSSRQINRHFNRQFGFPLKTFINIVRCNSTYNDIAKGDVFPSEEYFDQAHYIKEMKKYTGLTPKELSKNKNDRFLQLAKRREK